MCIYNTYTGISVVQYMQGQTHTFLDVALTFGKNFTIFSSFTHAQLKVVLASLGFKSLTPPTTHAQFGNKAHRAETKFEKGASDRNSHPVAKACVKATFHQLPCVLQNRVSIRSAWFALKAREQSWAGPVTKIESSLLRPELRIELQTCGIGLQNELRQGSRGKIKDGINLTQVC